MKLAEYIELFKMIKDYLRDPKKLNVILVIIIIILICVIVSGIISGLFYIKGYQQRIESLKEVQEGRELLAEGKVSNEAERFQLRIEKERQLYQSEVDSLKKLIVLKEDQIKELTQRIKVLEQSRDINKEKEILKLKDIKNRLLKEIEEHKRKISNLENKVQLYDQTFELLNKMIPDTVKRNIEQHMLNKLNDSSIDKYEEMKQTSKLPDDKEKITSKKVSRIEFDTISTVTGIKAKSLSNRKEDLPLEIDIKGSGDYAQLKVEIIENDTVIIDFSYGLMWQRGGSEKIMRHPSTKTWIEELNKKGYAGFHDWRLPIKEEVMTLLTSKKNGNLYIDSVFDKKQSIIWTSNETHSGERWAVNFLSGEARSLGYQHGCYVRAVRIFK